MWVIINLCRPMTISVLQVLSNVSANQLIMSAAIFTHLTKLLDKLNDTFA